MITIEIRENATGRICSYVEDGTYNDFLWTEGNYACDCNRWLFFTRSTNALDPDFKCSEGRFAVRITDEHGVIVLDEFTP